MIACSTHIALGSSAQDTSKGHGALTDAQLIADKVAYGWTADAFEIPADIKKDWEIIGSRRGRSCRVGGAFCLNLKQQTK